MSTTVHLTIPGKPVPLQRSRTRGGRHYLPPRSRAYRELVQAEWMRAGRPTCGDANMSVSMRFYGARSTSDLDNLCKALADALQGLAFTNDRQITNYDHCSKLPVDDKGPRAEIDLWAVLGAVA
jgi:crossover junction endodeoxyribonuclease RusA